MNYEVVFVDKITDLNLAQNITSSVFRSDKDLQAFLAHVGASKDSSFAQSLQLDFSTKIGILGVLPIQPDSGPNIKVASVAEDGKNIKVTFEKVAPSHGTPSGATVTVPVMYISIESTSKDVLIGTVDH